MNITDNATISEIVVSTGPNIPGWVLGMLMFFVVLFFLSEVTEGEIFSYIAIFFRMIKDNFLLLFREKKECYACDNKSYRTYEVYISENKSVEVCKECYKKSKECPKCEGIFFKDVKFLKFNNEEVCEYCGKKVKVCSECKRDYIPSQYTTDNKICSKCNKYNNAINKKNHMRCSEFINRKLTEKDTLEVFGVELEVIATKKIDASNPKLKYFEKGDDGSLSDGGLEFRSNKFIFNERSLKALQNFSEVASQSMYVDKSCGYHLHVFIHKNYQTLENFKKIIKGYILMEPLFMSMVSKSRRHNSYCRSIDKSHYHRLLNQTTLKNFINCFFEETYLSDEVVDAPKDHSLKHYDWVNLNSVFYRSTIEIRLHQGTTDWLKIANWYLIHKLFLQWLLTVDYNEVCTLTEHKFLNEIIKDKTLIKYIRKRINKFDKKTKPKKNILVQSDEDEEGMLWEK